MSEKKRRYELEAGGAKGYLAPLSFPAANAAMGYLFLARPKMLTAGGLLIKSLWVRGSKTLQEGGENYDEACLYAAGILKKLEQYFRLEDGSFDIWIEGKQYKYEFKKNVDREVLEDALGIMTPNVGQPEPLTAGFEILKANLIDDDKKTKLKEILANDELKVYASYACYKLMNFKGGQLKKI